MICPGLTPVGAVDGTVAGSDSGLSSHIQQIEIRKALPGVLPDLMANFIGYFSVIGTGSSQEALKLKRQMNLEDSASNENLMRNRLG